MAKAKHQSATPATEWLKKNKVAFEELSYEYVEHGGTAKVAEVFNLDHHTVVKTLIMEDEHAKPLVILMHGDCEVSTKNLARQAGVKHIVPCKPEQAQRNSGYQVGGTSPFGTRKNMPVFAEETIFDLPTIYINGGRRGFILVMPGAVLRDVLKAKPVSVAIKEE
ncbi:MAG: aminoacyl-tRNA deacylase [Burkholderiaceae bacterium]|jgi:Cys-tRNA(Pro) deacylase|nr:aminoacyl-tRNA deacylase [Burkholderiaceae bacterium]